MGKVRQLTGAKGQRQAAREAGRAQEAAGQAAISQQEAALERILDIQQPFAQVGQQAVGGLLAEILGGAPQSRGLASRRLPSFMQPQREAPQLAADTGFEFDVSPERVTEDPFFQELARDQEQRLLASAAARGKVGAGGTDLALNRNLLQLGQQFRQQDIANQIQEAQIQQGLRAEQAGLQSQRFGQMLNVAQLGANVATGQAGAIQGTAANVGNLLTGIGNVQAGTAIQRGNISAGTTGQLLGLAGGMGAGALAGSMGLFGDKVGAGGGALLGVLSDIRAKENIDLVAVDADGLNVYEYNYRHDADKNRYRGKMAQDIQTIDPDNVKEGFNGWLYVSEKYRPQRVA